MPAPDGSCGFEPMTLEFRGMVPTHCAFDADSQKEKNIALIKTNYKRANKMKYMACYAKRQKSPISPLSSLALDYCIYEIVYMVIDKIKL